jgi:LPS O-antigen subunit length determinant protein (WzzB/FepE family)
MNQDTKINEQLDDEINLREWIEHLKNGWQWLVGGGALGLVCSFVFLFLSSPQYEATAVIQPATIALTSTVSSNIEPTAITLERLKLTSFYSDQVVRVCEAKSAIALKETVKVNILKGNDLLSITYRTHSSERAKACLNNIVSELINSQTELAAPMIKELEAQLSTSKKNLEQAERLMAKASSLSSSTESNALDIMMLFNNERLLNLQNILNQKRLQLTSPLTQPMRYLEPIHVHDKPVTPQKLIAISWGLIGGLFIGLVALFLSRIWSHRKA